VVQQDRGQVKPAKGEKRMNLREMKLIIDAVNAHVQNELGNRSDNFRKYILSKNNDVVLAKCTEEADEFFESNKHRLFFTKLKNGIEVSTVFLPMDHGEENDPIFFETMVFKENSRDDIDCKRSKTYEEAKLSHMDKCEEFK
jgi:hypothetical protein